MAEQIYRHGLPTSRYKPRGPLTAAVFVIATVLLATLIMRGSGLLSPVALLAATAVTASPAAQGHGSCPAKSTNRTVDLSWHAPKSTSINDLGTLFNSTGVYGFIFNSSTVPAGTPYGTYNWCNMPHTRKREYKKAPMGYKLEYVELVGYA